MPTPARSAPAGGIVCHASVHDVITGRSSLSCAPRSGPPGVRLDTIPRVRNPVKSHLWQPSVPRRDLLPGDRTAKKVTRTAPPVPAEPTNEDRDYGLSIHHSRAFDMAHAPVLITMCAFCQLMLAPTSAGFSGIAKDHG